MKKIKGFTMIEILIISILISVGLLTVANAINHAKLVNQKVLQSVIANQIATEGAEIVYENRNTNFLKYYYFPGDEQLTSEVINSCRLAYDFNKCLSLSKTTIIKCGMQEEDETNSNRVIMSKGYYFISTSGGINTINKCIESIHGSNGISCSDIRNPIYAICLKDGVRSACTNESLNQYIEYNYGMNVGHNYGNDESTYGKFYRMIEGIGTYDMSAEDTLGGELSESSFCLANNNAQEYRFCSRVARDGGQGGEVEICSTMTNFAEIKGKVVR